MDKSVVIVDEVIKTLSIMDWKRVEYAARMIKYWCVKDHIIYTFGNGGSAAIAAHFTTDLMKLGHGSECPMTNIALVTMIVNDLDNGFDNLFTELLNYNIHQYMSIVAFSVSGTSSNIERLADFCHNNCVPNLFFTGRQQPFVYDINTIRIPSQNPRVVEPIFSIITHQIIESLDE